MNFVKRDGVRVAVKRELRCGEVLKLALDVSSIGKGDLTIAAGRGLIGGSSASMEEVNE
ncbi:MAG: hypothetical protein MK133_01505 [Planctomycetes bacterium]|nr:hypothetical protein [Planctomycetota bacterium]